MHLLEETGQMKVSALAEELNVSMETIRKDLAELESNQLIQKSHGKARLSNGPLMLPLSLRQSEQVSGKQSIARKAIDFIKDGSTIWLDTGSTVLAMVPFLSMKKDLMIVTDSIVAASALMDTRHKLFVVGGLLEPRGMCLTGPSAADALRTFHFDAAFFGTTGFKETKLPTTFSLDEVQLKREVLKRASHTYLLADDTKFDTVGPYIYAGFEDFDSFITNRITPEQKQMVAGITNIYVTDPISQQDLSRKDQAGLS